MRTSILILVLACVGAAVTLGACSGTVKRTVDYDRNTGRVVKTTIECTWSLSAEGFLPLGPGGVIPAPGYTLPVFLPDGSPTPPGSGIYHDPQGNPWAKIPGKGWGRLTILCPGSEFDPPQMVSTSWSIEWHIDDVGGEMMRVNLKADDSVPLFGTHEEIPAELLVENGCGGDAECQSWSIEGPTYVVARLLAAKGFIGKEGMDLGDTGFSVTPADPFRVDSTRGGAPVVINGFNLKNKFTGTAIWFPVD